MRRRALIKRTTTPVKKHTRKGNIVRRHERRIHRRNFDYTASEREYRGIKHDGEIRTMGKVTDFKKWGGKEELKKHTGNMRVGALLKKPPTPGSLIQEYIDFTPHMSEAHRDYGTHRLELDTRFLNWMAEDLLNREIFTEDNPRRVRRDARREDLQRYLNLTILYDQGIEKAFVIPWRGEYYLIAPRLVPKDR